MNGNELKTALRILKIMTKICRIETIKTEKKKE